MTRRPVSTPVRALAMASYLFPVAIALLALPAYRQVRLIRVHALVSLLLTGAVGLLVGVLGRITVYEVSLFIGLVLTLAICGYFGAAGWSALAAYQGRDPTVPLLTTLARRIEKNVWPRRPQLVPEPDRAARRASSRKASEPSERS